MLTENIEDSVIVTPLIRHQKNLIQKFWALHLIRVDFFSTFSKTNAPRKEKEN